jgi:hypothetical protein
VFAGRARYWLRWRPPVVAVSMPPLLGELIRLAVASAENAAVREARRSRARIAYTAALMALASGCAFAAIACAIAALWIALLPYCGAAGAPLVVSALLLVICAALVLLLRYGRTVVDQAPEPSALAGLSGLEPAAAIQLLKDHKVPVLIGALLVGLAAGSSRK